MHHDFEGTPLQRLTELSPETLAPDQRAVHDQIVNGPRGKISPPFMAMLHSPPLASVLEKVGVYLRYDTAVPARARELAVLVVCAHYRCGYEWSSHAPLAIAQGVDPEDVQAIGRGQDPAGITPDDAVVIAFAKALVRAGRADDATYDRAHRLFGESRMVDLTAMVGYYTLLAMTINAHQVPAPDGVVLPWEGA
jgi:4-carboxymuconolactone decarboxylase